MLWIGGRLSNLERLSIASYLANGHEVHVYAYQALAGVPPGARLLDARKILPESEVFRDRPGFNEGGYGAFSDGFRYKLLLDRGGAYSDADVVCLRPMDFLGREYAIARERVQAPDRTRSGREKMNGCFMVAPAGSAVMRDCYETFRATEKAAIQWGEVGPELATRKWVAHGLESHALVVDAICPVDYWDAPRLATDPLPELPPAVYAIHFWNGMWRHHGLHKDAAYPVGCAYETLKRRFGV